MFVNLSGVKGKCDIEEHKIEYKYIHSYIHTYNAHCHPRISRSRKIPEHRQFMIYVIESQKTCEPKL